MRYTVKINNQVYDVEIGDLHARPIIASIGNEQFEVWPEVETGAAAGQNSTGVETGETAVAPTKTDGIKIVRAPIPGMISDILVQAGQSVSIGQPLCVLDAMKMNNTIHAPRAGLITTVFVSIGQHVKHNDLLVEFAD
ncbi:MAG: acetyl-CoA carboxylase biotin carboxyl carrier protein subunit [Chloroflexi bacterium]|jgi:biotin carboxyl carrier protein|nr:acetyl-CoA carboxylase biotin carboxyl carrier protein subunit [Chloroflexota bacterium]MBK6709572.1 acetyl-CoA carboxylase biotin carboxyl carrier protein subunit [Chloroflexota bacterium]MBK7180274.1 acetyl-CoA carboxylase biotin carboxyl carrier protein subunit [Chloroflexota bacterium]MBK7915336.1 acetyl-CoA carboxylase biotin carboxyl carrier protein subunit [Chloroflexota bacterium]MBK8934177.1 acetyl-CoA carboxylase biotin carboxyl carrier protein subunit [Chloroflexota bacterium]